MPVVLKTAIGFGRSKISGSNHDGFFYKTLLAHTDASRGEDVVFTLYAENIFTNDISAWTAYKGPCFERL